MTDPEALAAEAPGIDFDDDGHRRLLRDVFPPLPADFDHPRPATADPQRFHLDNGQFGDADARALFALLRHRRPARMVEVGSGFVFLPDDYPPTRVVGQYRDWNEQYALQAMLAANPRWRAVFARTARRRASPMTPAPLSAATPVGCGRPAVYGFSTSDHCSRCGR